MICECPRLGSACGATRVSRAIKNMTLHSKCHLKQKATVEITSHVNLLVTQALVLTSPPHCYTLCELLCSHHPLPTATHYASSCARLSKSVASLRPDHLPSINTFCECHGLGSGQPSHGPAGISPRARTFRSDGRCRGTSARVDDTHRRPVPPVQAPAHGRPAVVGALGGSRRSRPAGGRRGVQNVFVAPPDP